VPASAADPITKGFGVVLAIVGSLYLVARPAANQFFYYSPESAFASVLAICFVVFASFGALRQKNWRAPDGLIALVVAWSALFAMGALRSPNRGEGVPQASDAILYGLMLVAGYYAGRIEPRLRVLFIRVIIAMVAVEAADGLYQSYIGFARLRQEIDGGTLVLPEDLKSNLGLNRIGGDDAQATFGNPNSLAAYLLVGFFLLLGHAWDGVYPYFTFVFSVVNARLKRSFSVADVVAPARPNRGRRAILTAFFSVALGGFFLWALYRTGSKGGGVALAAGIWFFALQRLTANGGWLQAQRRVLNLVTFNAISAAVLLLILCTLGVLSAHLFGLSMEVRFDYWKAALPMIKHHPFDGVGVAGYADWYNAYKTPMGWEVKDPHNEYVSLLAELGVLGPIIYCAIWGLVLKRSAGKVRAPAPPLVEHASWLVNPEFIGLIFGALALLVVIAGLDAFNAADVFNSLLRADRKWTELAGAAYTLCLPIFFALVFLLLRAHSKAHAASSGETVETSPALLHGFRAAAGAILMHQLVDFDFKAQAVMVSLLLCGGLFWSAADSAREAAAPRENSESVAAHLSRWIVPLLAVLLIPTTVWIPLHSGIARKEAQLAASDYQQLWAKDETPSTDPEEYMRREQERAEQLKTLPENVLAGWKRAGDAAPYDAAPRVEWAVAKMRWGKRTPGSNDEDAILKTLSEAEALRPRAPNIKAMLGAIYLRRAMKAALDSSEKEHKLLEQAHEKFAQARALYPLRPNLSLMEGDALLLLAQSEKACELYLNAFVMDIALNDPNVYLASIFTDKAPGAFVRHDVSYGQLPARTLILQESGVGAKGSRSRLGLLVRHMVALAQSIQEGLQYGRDTQAELEVIESEKINLLHTTSELLDSAPEGPMRAHATFLYALCVKAVHLKPKNVPDDKQEEDFKRRCDEANAFARKLQEESIRKGEPGTVPRVFDSLIPR